METGPFVGLQIGLLVVLPLQFGTFGIILMDLMACHCYNNSFDEFHFYLYSIACFFNYNIQL